MIYSYQAVSRGPIRLFRSTKNPRPRARTKRKSFCSDPELVTLNFWCLLTEQLDYGNSLDRILKVPLHAVKM